MCLSICLSVCRHYVVHICAQKLHKLPRYLRYHAAFNTQWFSFSKFFLDRKFTVRTIHHVFTFLWKYSSTRQGHEDFSGQSRGKQCSFMSLSAVIISGRYTARKQWKLYIINMKMATCPYIRGILIRHLIPSTLIKT